MYKVLFLCTGNSARSIMAEAIINQVSKGKFKGYSAGSHPAGQVDPYALKILKGANLSIDDLRSKSWDEFATESAPKMDFVITVCDKAKGEVCPIWPGQPMIAHWGVEDPAGSEDLMAFRNAYRCLKNRISLFCELPIEKLDRLKLQQELDAIGLACVEPE